MKSESEIVATFTEAGIAAFSRAILNAVKVGIKIAQEVQVVPKEDIDSSEVDRIVHAYYKKRSESAEAEASPDAATAEAPKLDTVVLQGLLEDLLKNNPMKVSEVLKALHAEGFDCTYQQLYYSLEKLVSAGTVQKLSDKRYVNTSDSLKEAL